MNGYVRSFHIGIARFFKFPTQGSTRTRRVRVSITNACTRMEILPLASAKSGTSQSCRATSVSLASGNRNFGGMWSV